MPNEKKKWSKSTRPGSKPKGNPNSNTQTKKGGKGKKSDANKVFDNIMEGVKFVGNAARTVYAGYKLVGKYFGKNHNEWYQSKDDGLDVRLPVGLNFGTNMSNPIHVIKEVGLPGALTTKRTVTQSSPTLVETIDMALTLGSPDNEVFAAESAIQKTFQILDLYNGRTTKYTSDDVGKYIHSSRVILAMLCSATRLLQCAYVGDSQNTRLKDVLMTAHCVNADDVSEEQLGDYAKQLATLWSTFLKTYPMAGDVYSRTMWLFSNVFSDTDGLKKTLIIPRLVAPILVNKSDEMEQFDASLWNSVTHGYTDWSVIISDISRAMRILKDTSAVDGGNLLSDIRLVCEICNDEIAQLVRSVFSALEDGIHPIYDVKLCRQFENAKVALVCPIATSHEQYYVQQQSGTYFKYTYEVSSDPASAEIINQLGDYFNMAYINGTDQSVGSATKDSYLENLSLTRLCPTFDVTTSGYTPAPGDADTYVLRLSSKVCGTEVPLAVHAYSIEGNDATGDIRSTPIPSVAMFAFAFDSAGIQSASNENMRRLARIMQAKMSVDYSPSTVAFTFDPLASNDGRVATALNLFSFDTYAPISSDSLGQMHADANYALIVPPFKSRERRNY